MEDSRLKMAIRLRPEWRDDDATGDLKNAPKGAADFFVHDGACYATVKVLQRPNVGRRFMN